MGVYIFNSRHKLTNGDSWMKVGFHKRKLARFNVYYRLRGRGFRSLKHPPELADKLDVKDVELLHWFPNLKIRDERRLHASLKTKFKHVGEWYLHSDLPDILKAITEYGGIGQSFSPLSTNEIYFLSDFIPTFLTDEKWQKLKRANSWWKYGNEEDACNLSLSV
jgi:hypothetical protein